jgi:hypothetical protein
LPTENPDFQAAGDDSEAERLSRELREQVKLAKDRISDRYAKLVETRSSGSGGRREG